MHVRNVLLVAASVLLAAASPGRACTTDGDCNDGNVCSGTETCQAGTCYPGYPQNCGNIPNFVSWCHPLTGCNYQLSIAFVGCDAPSAAAFAFAMAKARCGCEENTTHGQYVRCVARETADDGLPRNCRGLVKRCAARSTCGKPSDSVTCCVAAPGWCDGSLCQDGVTPCSGAEDCPPRKRCSVKPSAAACIARGGTPGGGGGSCCDAPCLLP